MPSWFIFQALGHAKKYKKIEETNDPFPSPLLSKYIAAFSNFFSILITVLHVNKIQKKGLNFTNSLYWVNEFS